MMTRTALLMALLALGAGANLAPGQNLLYNGDFEADPFLDGWTVSTNVTSFGGLAPGSTTAANLNGTGQRVGQAMFGAADWALDFYFAVQDAGANRAFSLLVNQFAGPETTGSATINLRYQSGQFNAYAAGAWGSDLGLGTISPSIDANNDGDFNDVGDTKNVYHMRVSGAGWGTPTASYGIQLSDANTTNFTRSVNGLTRYHSGSGVTGGPMAFVLNSAYGNNPGFWVDDVTYEEFYVADDPKLELVTTGDLFGRLPVDSPAVTRDLILTNSGATKNLYITNALVSGSDAARYTLGTVFPVVLPPGGSTNLSVTFNPGTVSGQFSATLQLNSNDRGTPAFNVNLAATRLVTGTQLLANPGFELNPFSSGWIADTNLARANGLVGGSVNAARLNSGARLGQNIICSGDWYLECLVALAEPVNQAFSMYVTSIGDIFNANEVKLRVTCQGTEWSIGGNPQPDLGTVALSVDTNADGDLSSPEDVRNVYRLRVIGHGWDTASATVDVQVSEANQLSFTRGVYGIPVVNPLQAAPYGFAFDALTVGNPGFWVDETRVFVGLQPLKIDSLVLANSAFRMTWGSEPNATYYLETTETLGSAWQPSFGPISSEGATTSYTNAVSGGARFFRLRKE